MHLLKGLLLLQVAFSVAVNAGKPAARPLFDEWLERRTTAALPASAKPSSAAPKNYDQVETEIICLKELADRNCRTIGCTDFCYPGVGGCLPGAPCVSKSYVEASFTCCQPEDYLQYGYDYDIKPKVPAELAKYEIGDCQVVLDTFTLVNVTKGVYKAGTYTMHCAVKQGGEYCGHPFCDSLVFDSKGTILWIDQVISMTNPPWPTLDKSCDDLLKVASVYWRANLPARLSGMAEMLGKSSSHATLAFATSGPSGYFLGGSVILRGPMSITSRKYDVKYREGTLEYTFFFADPTLPDGVAPTIDAAQAEAADMLMVNPNTFTLRLVKPRGY